MTTAYTSLLGLALPVTGELSGTWGDTVNTAITSLLDTAVAGTTSITTDADITLSTTTGASNEARQAIILWNPASGTTTRNITAPAQSKMYTVINASGGTQSIVIRGAGPTTGVTVLKGESALVAWNGSDFVKVSSVGGSSTFIDLTVTGNTILGDTAADTLTVNATSTFASPVSFQGQVKLPSTGRSAAAALTPTNPAFLYGVASTYTDTTSSGTLTPVASFYGLAQPTLSTSNVTTYTSAATLYIANAPAAGGSATITNPYALYSAAGANYFGGVATFNSTTQFNGVATHSANVLFSADNTYDIGAVGATRPRTLYLGTSLIAPAITNSGLTAGRVTYATTGGLLTDSANLTFSGSALTVTGTAATDTTGLTLSGTTTGYNRIAITNTSASLYAGITNSANGGGPTGTTTNDGYIFTNNATGLALGVNGATIGRFSSTGLAVTGALSTTGNITNSNSAGRLDFTGASSAQVWATASSLYLDAATGQSVIIRPNNQVTAGTFSSTGLAVTGALSATGGTSVATSSGYLTVGTVSATGMNASDLGIPNNKYLRGTVAAGTSSVALIGLDPSNVVQINANGSSGGTTVTGTLTATTSTSAASAVVATATSGGGSGKVVLVNVGNNSSTGGGGNGVVVYDRSDNSGGAQTGVGLYAAAPYDGTNASGGTYGLIKYGLYVDDIYSYNGLNSTTSDYNTGIYIKGGGRNYIKAPLTLDGQLVVNSNLIVTGITYSSGFYFNGGGTQNILTISAGEAYLFYSVYTAYGPGDNRHGIYYLAAVSTQASSGVQLAALSGTGGFSISSGVVSYSAGGGNPTTVIWWQKLSG